MNQWEPIEPSRNTVTMYSIHTVAIQEHIASNHGQSTKLMSLQHLFFSFTHTHTKQGFIQKEIFWGKVGVAVSCTVTPPPIKH